MDFVRLAAERLSSTLRQRDRVIVAPFNAHIGTITGPTNDGPTIAQAIRVMRAAGGTAFLDGLRESTTPARGRRRPPHHRAHHRRLRREQHDANRGRAEDALKRLTSPSTWWGSAAWRAFRSEATRCCKRIAERDRRPRLLSAARAGTRQHRRRRVHRRPQPVPHHLHAGESEPGRQVAAGSRRRARTGISVRTRDGYFAPRPRAHPTRRSNSG